ncbi:MAG: hypothetical protein E6K84_03205 [Thaumarchaeota archaeon]|nr:MAG: hypothetical protein E6K84_03205 [Nitrososphaerota archaeon]
MVGNVNVRRSPEWSTPVERLVNLVHLPYAWGCLFWAILFGVGGRLLGGYVDTFDPKVTLTRILDPNLSLWQAIANLVLNLILIPFLLIFSVRFMRLRVVQSELELSAISPHGEETLHKVFGGVSRLLPPILIGAAVIGLYAIPGASPTVRGGGNPGLGDLSEIVSSIFTGFCFGSFLWVYLSSLRGLHKVGGEALGLRSSSEDPMLGLRPLGSISLSLAGAYFAVLFLGALTLIILPFGFSDIALLLIFLITGMVMFFLPLNNIHRKMQQEKRLEQSRIREQFNELAKKRDNPGHEDSRDVLTRMERLLTIQMLEQKVSAVPTWPFDTSILGRFFAITLSVAAILIARLIMIELHL